MKIKDIFNPKYIKNNILNWLWWFLLGYAILDIITNTHSLTRWKWGYFTIDWIPDLILLFILLIWNYEKRFRRLENELLKEVRGEKKC